MLDSTPPTWQPRFETLPTLADPPAPPSIEVPPKLELKPLPANLKYIFLGPDDTLPAIIASYLSDEQEAFLMCLKNTKMP